MQKMKSKIEKYGKSIKLSMIKCKKCKRKLDIRITTELSEKDEKKGKEPKVLMVYGICDKCEIVYMIEIIPFEDIPKMEEKKARKLGLIE